MRNYIKFVALSLLLISMKYTYAYSSPNAYTINPDSIPFVNDYDCYIEVPVNIRVLDKEVLSPYVSRLNDMKTLLSEELENLESGNNDFDKEINQNNSRVEYVKKILQDNDIPTISINTNSDKKWKIKSPADRDTLYTIFSAFINNNDNRNLRRIDNNSNIEKFFKELKKGKFQFLGFQLFDIYTYNNAKKNEEILSIKKDTIKTKRATIAEIDVRLNFIDKYSNNQLPDYIGDEELWKFKRNYNSELNEGFNIEDQSSWPLTTVVESIKVKNKYRRDPNLEYSQLSFIDSKAQKLGWEWLDNEKDYEVGSEHFPIAYEYKVYNSHPEFKIIEGCVYTQKGDLVRVIEFTDKIEEGDKILAACNKITSRYNEQLIIDDYKNNKYNIKNEGKDVVYAVENLIGLSDDFKKSEERRLRPYVQQLENALLSGNKRKYDELRNKYSLIIYGPKPNDPEKNSKAKKFIEQCNQDHQKDRLKLWKIERTGDLSFNLIFLNNINTEYRILELSFTGDGAFGCKSNFNTDIFMEPQPFDPTPYVED